MGTPTENSSLAWPGWPGWSGKAHWAPWLSVSIIHVSSLGWSPDDLGLKLADIQSSSNSKRQLWKHILFSVKKTWSQAIQFPVASYRWLVLSLTKGICLWFLEGYLKN